MLVSITDLNHPRSCTLHQRSTAEHEHLRCISPVSHGVTHVQPQKSLPPVSSISKSLFTLYYTLCNSPLSDTLFKKAPTIDSDLPFFISCSCWIISQRVIWYLSRWMLFRSMFKFEGSSYPFNNYINPWFRLITCQMPYVGRKLNQLGRNFLNEMIFINRSSFSILLQLTQVVATAIFR